MMTEQATATPPSEAFVKALEDLKMIIGQYNSARSLATQKYQAELAAIEDQFTQMDPEGAALRQNGIPSTKANRLKLVETLQNRSTN